MSFYRIVSMLICVFSVLVYVLRFLLVLYNHVRISFLENDARVSRNSREEQSEKKPTGELISILVHISHADFIMPLLHTIRKQNYKNIELLVSVSHENKEISRSLKEAVITSHREYVSHIPLLVFLGRSNVEENMPLLASAAKGEYICILDQRTRLSPKSISTMMKKFLLRGVNVLSVIPNLLGSSKLLRSYAAMTHIAFRIRRHLPYVLHSTSDVFSLMCAGDYYNYVLSAKGHKKYTRNKDVSNLFDAGHTRRHHAHDASHAHVFSSEITYHMFSSREYLAWFIDAFRCVRNGKNFKTEKSHAPQKSNRGKIRFFKLRENCTELMALWYAMVCIVVQAVVLLGVFVETYRYGITYVVVCIISFITHYVCVRSYGVRLYQAILQWMLSPIPYFHALGALCIRVIGKVMHRHTDTDTSNVSHAPRLK